MSRLGAAAISVGCGAAAAALYLAVALGSPSGLILVYLTQLPLFAAGLWLGFGASAIAGAAAMLALLAASDVMAAALFAALNVVPVTILVRQALLARRQPDGTLQWYPPGLLAAWLTGMALAGIGAAVVALGGPANLQASLHAVMSQFLARLPIEGTERGEVAAALALVIPGVVASSWMVMAVINAALAQGLLSRFKVNWRPSPELAALDLPLWLSAAFAIAAAMTALGGAARFLGVNALIALIVPFTLAGLGVLHAAVRHLAHPAMALVVFYILAGLFGWPLAVVAILGLFEPWLGLRRRLASVQRKT
jgi:hypothetical protein